MLRLVLPLVTLFGCTDILGIDERTLVGDGGAPATGGGGAATGAGSSTGANTPNGGGGASGGGGDAPSAGGGQGGNGGGGSDCPLLSCGGSCVNPFTDDAHCGYCDVGCADGQTCRNGLCAQRLRTSPGGDQCARFEEGMFCWGDAFNGEAGTGVAVSTPRFPAHEVTILDGLPPARFISQSADVSCALLDDGSIRCFGDNRTGGLGIGVLGGPDDGDGGNDCCYVTEPVEPAFPGAPVFVDVAGGAAGWEPEFFVALTETGDVYCWGDGATTPAVKLTNAVQIIAGIAFACALDDEGKVSCWGSPWSEAASDPICARPLEVFDALPPIRMIGGSHYSGFAVTQDDEVYAWGDNRYGTLGPSFEPVLSYYPPRRMDHDFPSPVVQIAGLHWATCARLLDGSVYCWGIEGFLGDGIDFGDDIVPEPVLTLVEAASEIAAGYDDMAAIDGSGAVRVWSNWYSATPQELPR